MCSTVVRQPHALPSVLPHISSAHLAPGLVLTILLTTSPVLCFTCWWLFCNYLWLWESSWAELPLEIRINGPWSSWKYYLTGLVPPAVQAWLALMATLGHAVTDSASSPVADTISSRANLTSCTDHTCDQYSLGPEPRQRGRERLYHVSLFLDECMDHTRPPCKDIPVYSDDFLSTGPSVTESD